MTGHLRGAVESDVAELVRLRAGMITALGGDAGGPDAVWRATAPGWFRDRLVRPQEWAFRVVGPPGGALEACGAAWLTEHLPGPAAPTGWRGYIGFMFTDEAARRRGHGRRILASLGEWLTSQGMTRWELNASADGRALYEAEGFVPDDFPAMYRVVGLPPGRGGWTPPTMA